MPQRESCSACQAPAAVQETRIFRRSEPSSLRTQRSKGQIFPRNQEIQGVRSKRPDPFCFGRRAANLAGLGIDLMATPRP